MDRWLFLIVIMSFIFIITYDPKSKNLENLIPKKESMEADEAAIDQKKPCCSVTKYRAENPYQCEPGYYQGLQFADTDYGCPVVSPVVYEGAIMSR
jgi:hypothetical protein